MEELEKIWKETVMAKWKYDVGIYLRGLTEIAKASGEPMFRVILDPSAFRLQVYLVTCRPTCPVYLCFSK
jgi:hypothetical protein